MFNRIRGVSAETGIVSVVSALLMAGLAFTLLFWHLGSLTAGMSPLEVSSRANSANLNAILGSPVNAPHRLLQNIAQNLGYHGATSMRMASVFFALVFLGCFYRLLCSWFGRFIGLLGVLMLAGTPLFILTARSASPAIMYLSPLLVVLGYMYFMQSKKNATLGLLVFCFSVALCLYSPGALWFLLIMAVLFNDQLLNRAKQISNRQAAVSAAMMIILLAPLAWAVGRHYSVAATLLLLPTHWHGLNESLRAGLWVIPSFIWHTSTPSQFNIGKIAILSASQIVLVVFGLYALISQARREALTLAIISIFGVIIVSLDSSVDKLIVFLPIAAVLVAAGLRYLFVEWHSIFPKNPIPRALAATLFATLVAFQLVWGFHFTMVAWPHSTATKNVYVIK